MAFWIANYCYFEQVKVSTILYKLLTYDLFWNSNESNPYPTDSDDYSLYENPHWKPIPWYSKVINSIYQCLFTMTGPKFLVPFIGKCFRKNSGFNFTLLDLNISQYWRGPYSISLFHQRSFNSQIAPIHILKYWEI